MSVFNVIHFRQEKKGLKERQQLDRRESGTMPLFHMKLILTSGKRIILGQWGILTLSSEQHMLYNNNCEKIVFHIYKAYCCSEVEVRIPLW